MINRYFTIANFFLITVAVYLCVNAFYTFVTARLDYGITSGVTVNRVSSAPAEISHPPLADYTAITKRNIFNSSTQEDCPENSATSDSVRSLCDCQIRLSVNSPVPNL